jgi:hypothetical protein
MTNIVERFTYVNSRGEEVLEKDFLPIWCKNNDGVFDLAAYHWYVGEKKFFAKAGNINEQDIPYFRPSRPIKPTLLDRLLRRKLPIPKRFVSFKLLPDSSGFLRFESGWDRADNCLLLDAYGKERMRLTVPWELTGREISKDAVMCFKNVSEPYINPMDGKQGQFGVSAYIEGSGSGGYAEGDWYFELDYHTGKFLWGKEIRS